MMKRIAVLASGEGTNLEAILEAVERGEISGRVVLVISDREKAPALERARRRGVRALFLDPRAFPGREAYDEALAAELQEAQVDLVVLAGFMRLLSPVMVRAFPMRIMNIHPSLLPSFPGTEGVRDALEYGVKVTGCTVHFVDEGLDTGPIILQEAVPVIQGDTVETLHARIHAAEYRLYPRAIELFCQNKLRVEGRRCYIDAE
ncbi:MAG: phosphoribosylglycinamide formyltransferase [Firmicutes bacterium]|jgi:phosphoribosylglycinamide formyltransferase-1|nr:phosphoribosylglycinamide formyltransferase [Bacillota bacterium]HPU00652.1 phosphoribosylglycinamide formyltransferase [Bacillota bacterium]